MFKSFSFLGEKKNENPTKMESAMRVLNPVHLNRHISSTTLSTRINHFHNLSPHLLHHPRNHSFIPLSLSSNALLNPTFPNSPRLGFPLSFSSSTSQFPSNAPINGIDKSFNSFKFDSNNDDLFKWHKASNPISGPNDVRLEGGETEVGAVILGWLGARPKHLRRYAELYTCRGIDALTFVVPVKDVLWFDLGRKVEARIRDLANELVSWLSKDEGKQRCLVFHTFSNTGWLVYGAILGHLQERPDLIEKIRGCIVDSGGDPELNPKVWAAGFTGALLKKHITYSLSEATESNRDRNGSKLLDEDPRIVEAALLLVLEKIFSFLFKLPDVKQRLLKIISLLSENQPLCPQLYLYSTADKVIPYQAVESFIQHQKMKGRTVHSLNFGSSPHVDHYRTFPDVYSSQVNSFLNEVLVLGKQI